MDSAFDMINSRSFFVKPKKRITIVAANSDTIVFVMKATNPSCKKRVDNLTINIETIEIRKALNTTFPKNPFIFIPTKGLNINNLAIKQEKETHTDTTITISGGAPNFRIT